MPGFHQPWAGVRGGMRQDRWQIEWLTARYHRRHESLWRRQIRAGIEEAHSGADPSPQPSPSGEGASFSGHRRPLF